MMAVMYRIDGISNQIGYLFLNFVPMLVLFYLIGIYYIFIQIDIFSQQFNYER